MSSTHTAAVGIFLGCLMATRCCDDIAMWHEAARKRVIDDLNSARKKAGHAPEPAKAWRRAGPLFQAVGGRRFRDFSIKEWVPFSGHVTS